MIFTRNEELILRDLSKYEVVSALGFKASMSVQECSKAAKRLKLLGFIQFLGFTEDDTNDFFFKRTPKCVEYIKKHKLN